MKVLVCDDEKLIRDVVREYLELNDYEVVEASDGDEAIELVNKDNFDIIIMDIMMPHKDGYQTVKEIKEIKDSIPVIMLSARGEEYDKLHGFDLGIDDYVTKPFSPKELVARVKAITKRKEVKKNKTINYGNLELDDVAHEVRVDGKLVTLTPKEYDLLKYFFQNEHIALTREQLLNNVWGYDFYGDDRTIDTHVKTLRQHLGSFGEYIKTVRKVGYKFEYDEAKE